MSDYVVEAGARQKGVTIVKPIVYGNIARYFGNKREEDGHTHQWTVFVKPYLNEDMSVYVKKMNFKLHESYANPMKVITKPPYEVTETGWGEFEVVIKVYFNDPNEKPVTIYHLLKLFQTDAEIMNGKKNLVSEFYDEMVFQDPSSALQRMLLQQRPLNLGPYTHETNFEERKQREQRSIEATCQKVKEQTRELTQALKQNKEEIGKFKQEIINLENSILPVPSIE